MMKIDKRQLKSPDNLISMRVNVFHEKNDETFKIKDNERD